MWENEFFGPKLVGLFRSGRCNMVCVLRRIGRVRIAKQYGGKFSPKGTPDNARDGIEDKVNKFRGQKAYNSNIRAKLLFLVPLPLLFAAIGELRVGDANGMMAELGAFILLILAAWLLRDGLQAEDAYNAHKVARPPAIPRKLFASVLTGAGISVAAHFGWGQPLVSSVAFGIVAGLAHVFSFGVDPMKKKGMEGLSEFDAQRVAKAVDKAEKLLKDTITASKRFNDCKLEGRVESLAACARKMFRTVEENPRDLTGARKFMGVYLKGARDATVKFADLYAKKRDTATRTDYAALLIDLEATYSAQSEVMLLDDRSDLEIEIEVLRDRLKQEGVKARL